MEDDQKYQVRVIKKFIDPYDKFKDLSNLLHDMIKCNSYDAVFVDSNSFKDQLFETHKLLKNNNLSALSFLLEKMFSVYFNPQQTLSIDEFLTMYDIYFNEKYKPYIFHVNSTTDFKWFKNMDDGIVLHEEGYDVIQANYFLSNIYIKYGNIFKKYEIENVSGYFLNCLSSSSVTLLNIKTGLCQVITFSSPYEDLKRFKLKYVEDIIP